MMSLSTRATLRICRRCAMPLLRHRSDCIACTSNTDNDPPRAIGPYEIVEMLGAGALGTVYRCSDAVDGRSVAVKLLRWPFRPDLTERWAQDARAVARIDDPSIASIRAIGRARELRYVVTEMIEAPSVAELIEDNGRMDVAPALGIVRATAQSLATAHARDIHHRGLRPSNVYVLDDGCVKLTDFGQAVPYTAGDEARMSVATWPAARYLSPEQVHRGISDQRSDVHALGLTLFFMLTGLEPPGLGQGQQNRRLPTVNMIVPEVSAGVSALVERMTDPRPTERPPHMHAVIAAIDALESAHTDSKSTDDLEVPEIVWGLEANQPVQVALVALTLLAVSSLPSTRPAPQLAEQLRPAAHVEGVPAAIPAIDVTRAED